MIRALFVCRSIALGLSQVCWPKRVPGWQSQRRPQHFRLLLMLAAWLLPAAFLSAQEPPEPSDDAAPPAAVSPAQPEAAPAAEPVPVVGPTADTEGAPPEPDDEVPMEIPPAETPPTEKPPAETPPNESPIDPTQHPADPTKAASAEGEERALAELRRTAPRELLELAGINHSQFRSLQDGWPLGDNELELTLKLMYRILRFGQVDTTLWSQPHVPVELMANHPEDYRMQMFALRGRVVQVTVETPPAEMVQGYEFNKYYACLVELEGSKHPLLVVTPTIPKQWDLTQPIDELISAQGMFVKVGERRGDLMQLVFVAPRIAWHPDQSQAAATQHSANLGMIELGRLGMDVGLLDVVQNREGITDKDREAFYQMLAAVNRAPQNQLVRFAQASLPELQKTWQEDIVRASRDLKTLQAELEAFQGSAEEKEKLSKKVSAASRRIAVLQKAVKEAQEGRYSVYPLFNLADEQHGQLVYLEGIARRAIKVEVANPRDPESNRDIITRFGIDHYYEMAIFTKDSADNPLIVCVRELPPGFPAGEKLNQSVQIAGFFFKTWAYYTTEGAVAKGQNPPEQRRQLAPLLIARSPIWVKNEGPSPDSGAAAIIGAVFLLLMIVASVSVWRFNKRDEQFRKNVMVRKYEIDSGTSLDDFGLVTVDGPDFSHLKDEAANEETSSSPPTSSEAS